MAEADYTWHDLWGNKWVWCAPGHTLSPVIQLSQDSEGWLCCFDYGFTSLGKCSPTEAQAKALEILRPMLEKKIPELQGQLKALCGQIVPPKTYWDHLVGDE